MLFLSIAAYNFLAISIAPSKVRCPSTDDQCKLIAQKPYSFCTILTYENHL